MFLPQQDYTWIRRNLLSWYIKIKLPLCARDHFIQLDLHWNSTSAHTRNFPSDAHNSYSRILGHRYQKWYGTKHISANYVWLPFSSPATTLFARIGRLLIKLNTIFPGNRVLDVRQSWKTCLYIIKQRYLDGLRFIAVGSPRQYFWID